MAQLMHSSTEVSENNDRENRLNYRNRRRTLVALRDPAISEAILALFSGAGTSRVPPPPAAADAQDDTQA